MIRQFEGGYSDYLIRKELESPESGNVSASLKAQNASSGKDNSESDENENNSANSQDAWKRREKKLKFSFKEQREFDTIDEEKSESIRAKQKQLERKERMRRR